MKIIPIRKGANPGLFDCASEEYVKPHEEIIVFGCGLEGDTTSIHWIRANTVVAAKCCQIFFECKNDVWPKVRFRSQNVIHQFGLYCIFLHSLANNENKREDLVQMISEVVNFLSVTSVYSLSSC